VFLEKVSAMIFPIRSTSGEPTKTLDSGRQLGRVNAFFYRETREEVAHESRNAGRMTVAVSPALRDGALIDQEIQAFLGHFSSNAHKLATNVRTSRSSVKKWSPLPVLSDSYIVPKNSFSSRYVMARR
jgi:hypothetical protein